ncbi:MAG: hypothetical protein WCF68_05355 [Terriglobales bacterium]
MRFRAAPVVLILIVSLHAAVSAQNPSPPSLPSATIPMALDQDRIVIDVDLPLPNGSTERIRGWVDNGNPDLWMNRRVANLLGLGVTCAGQICSGTPKAQSAALEVLIGGVRISLSQAREKVGEIKIPANTPELAPGMSAEINIPSSALRNYDVLISFPDREFAIGLPGRLKFSGVKAKMIVNSNNGLIQMSSRIENKNYDLGLDLGSSINFFSEELFGKLSKAHPDWPHMTGAIGPFNTGEPVDEPKWKLMRVDRVQYGPLFLTDVAVANAPASLFQNRTSTFAQRPGFITSGVLSSEALLNYRVGLDYAHSTVYFDIGRTTRFPDFDVVGLILGPEDDTGFTIVGVADFDGKPSVAGIQPGDCLVAIGDTPVADFTLGQTWSLLEGAPGQDRKLTIARAGKQFTVVAKVQHFLGDPATTNDANGKSKKN